MSEAPVATGCPDAAASAQLRQLIGDAFAGFAGSAAYPCLGARSVIHRQACHIGVYGRLGSAAAAGELHSDLVRFGQDVGDAELASFVAVFTDPSAMTEAHFSELLWRQLQHLHDVDATEHHWDARVSADPEDPHFSFSVGGSAFFIVGLHPGSSRWARRFAWPALVFNPHQQFEAMRQAGKYQRVRSAIRERDALLQGTINPVLRDHGCMSEARQYAGDAVSESWRCPLVVHPRS